MMRRRVAVTLLAGLAAMMPLSLGAATPTDVVVISPGQDIQPVVDAHLPGTSYLLRPGTHRLQSIQPKDGDSFTGQFGALMSGAVELEGFAQRGGYWLTPAPRA